MSGKSLPAYLQQALEHYVSNAQLTHDEELQDILDRLKTLNDKVEQAKAKIQSNRQSKLKK